jgi:hypothetical protein
MHRYGRRGYRCIAKVASDDFAWVWWIVHIGLDDFNFLHKNTVDETKKLHKMSLPLPVTFKSCLTADRLAQVSKWLLEELFATEDDLNRDTDGGYTRGCTTFGRQRSRIIAEAIRGRNHWLGISNNGNDLVFTIEGVPCRFSNDDPTNPSKDAVLIANRYQQDFLEFATKGEPARFCFVIDRGFSEAGDHKVAFLGFSPSNEIVCKWESDSMRTLRLEASESKIQPVEIAKPQVTPKRRDEGDTQSASM